MNSKYQGIKMYISITFTVKLNNVHNRFRYKSSIVGTHNFHDIYRFVHKLELEKVIKKS